MKAINRSILAGITASVIAMGGMSVPAWAAVSETVSNNTAGITAANRSDSTALEGAILKAKGLVNVPASYTEFEQSSYTNTFYGQKLTIWDLTWSEPKGQNSVNVSVDSLGNLLSYQHWTEDNRSNQDSMKISKISREDAIKIAGDFIGKVMGQDVQSKMVEVQDFLSRSKGGYSFAFQYREGGVPVPAITVYVQVDRQTGAVDYFSGLSMGMGVPKSLPNKTGAMTKAAAREAYLKQIGMELKYYSVYDDTANKWNVIAAYGVKGPTDLALDAKTGQGVWVDHRYYSDLAAGEGAAIGYDAKNSPQLTPQEKKAISEVSGLLTVEEAAAKVTGYVSDSRFKQSVQSSNLYKKRNEAASYYWNLSYDKGSAIIDAKNGELLGFNIWPNLPDEGDVIEEQARVIAEAFLKKATPERFKLTKLSTPIKTPYINQRSSQGYTFTYDRQANGITVEGDYLSVFVDTAGSITNYYSNWNNDLVFPDISKVISDEAAFDTLAGVGNGFNLSYDMKKNLDMSKTSLPITYALTYRLDLEAYGVLVDANTGARVMAYNPTTAYEDMTPGSYSDLSGHKIESTVKVLADNGYYLPSKDGKFNPERKITQVQFLKYLMPVSYQTTDDEFYRYLMSNGIITAAEKSPSKEVTQLEAVKFMVRSMGLERAAQISSIYTLDAQTINVPAADAGYVVLARGMGIFAGNTFDGAQIMTNSSAATHILETVKAY